MKETKNSVRERIAEIMEQLRHDKKTWTGIISSEYADKIISEVISAMKDARHSGFADFSLDKFIKEIEK